jgi:predicted ATP-grasp superfamily ATP-dependent carboligase
VLSSIQETTRNRESSEIKSMRKRQPYAVVVYIDSAVGLQTARILASRGVPVIGIARNYSDFFCRTNVCEKIIIRDTSSGDLIEFLSILGRNFSQKAVLIPCNDWVVLDVSLYREILDVSYHVVLPEHKIVETLLYKASFYNYALEENLPISRTFFLQTKEDAVRAAELMTFPCIVKPSFRTSGWFSKAGAKVLKVHTGTELLSVYDRCVESNNTLVTQEWIVGPDSNLYSCNCYFDAESEPLVTFTARKLRQWPPEAGFTSLGEECRNEFVLNQSIDLFRKTKFRGLGYLEMKLDERTQKYYIIEANIGRPTRRSALAETCGVELLYTMYCDTVGWQVPQETKQEYRGVKWIDLVNDFKAAKHYWRRGDLTFLEWYRSVRGPKCHAILSWSDPLPFIAQVGSQVWSVLCHHFRRLKRRAYRFLVG